MGVLLMMASCALKRSNGVVGGHCAASDCSVGKQA